MHVSHLCFARERPITLVLLLEDRPPLPGPPKEKHFPRSLPDSHMPLHCNASLHTGSQLSIYRRLSSTLKGIRDVQRQERTDDYSRGSDVLPSLLS